MYRFSSSKITLVFVALSTLIITAFTDQTESTHQRCAYNVSSGDLHPPILLTTSYKPVLPVLVKEKEKRFRQKPTSKVAFLEANEEFYIACLGGTNRIATTGRQLKRAKCIETENKATWGIPGYKETLNTFKASDFRCAISNKETVKKNGKCFVDNVVVGTSIQVGYSLVDDNGEHFIKLYESCLDATNAAALYSRHEIPIQSISARNKETYDRKFVSGSGLFPINHMKVNKAYSAEEQIKTLAKILKSQSLAERYIIEDEFFFLSPSPLTPSEDFVDASSQNATYYHFNAAPMWESFNEYNWWELKMHVRVSFMDQSYEESYISVISYNLEKRVIIDEHVKYNTELMDKDAHLVVYTGTYGILHLSDSEGVPQPIYLTFDSEGSSLIPVPKYFWKVVYHSYYERAIAVVMINNPHMSRVAKEDVFCRDVCADVSWINWDVTNIKKGYMFCCTVADLHKVVRHAPNLDALLLAHSDISRQSSLESDTPISSAIVVVLIAIVLCYFFFFRQ